MEFIKLFKQFARTELNSIKRQYGDLPMLDVEQWHDLNRYIDENMEYEKQEKLQKELYYIDALLFPTPGCLKAHQDVGEFEYNLHDA